MSGGYYEYKQYEISRIAETIKDLIYNSENKTSEYCYYSEETIKEFKNAVDILNKAYVYAQRIDWLHSGDDSEETFHKRLKHDLEKIF